LLLDITLHYCNLPQNHQVKQRLRYPPSIMTGERDCCLCNIAHVQGLFSIRKRPMTDPDETIVTRVTVIGGNRHPDDYAASRGGTNPDHQCWDYIVKILPDVMIVAARKQP
jgi:hypothetical protein